MSRCRSPQQQADEFISANKHFLAVAGSAVLHRNRKRVDGSPLATGVRYKLQNNKWYHLGSAAIALLPDEFPRWLIVDGAAA